MFVYAEFWCKHMTKKKLWQKKCAQHISLLAVLQYYIITTIPLFVQPILQIKSNTLKLQKLEKIVSGK